MLSASSTLSLICALFFFFQGGGTTPPVRGRIVQKGLAVVGAKVVYTDPDKGRKYTATTDGNGEFAFAAVPVGAYDVEIFAKDGKRVYRGRRAVTLPAGLKSGMEDRPVPLSPVQQDNVLDLDVAVAGHTPTDAATSELNALIDQTHSALAAHDWPGAHDLLERLIALAPDRWAFYQNKGAVEIYMGHYSEAVTTFEQAIEVAKRILGADTPAGREEVSNMLRSEGEAYDHLARFDEAVTAYKESAELSPHPALNYFLACDAEQRANKPQDAAGLCQQAIAADPTLWEAVRTLAGIQGETDPQTAIQTYERGITAAKQQLAGDPNSDAIKSGIGQMRNAEGNLYVRLKQWQSALDAFTEATQYAPYPALPWSNLCATYFNMGRMSEAATACDKTVTLDPYFENAYFLKAAALVATAPATKGKKYVAPPGAREALQKYLALAPTGTYAREAQTMLRSLGPP